LERLYETTIVLDPQLKSTEIEDAIKKVTNFISNHGGEIVKVDEWGKRRLAYEINKKQYGYYVYIRFNAPGQIVRLLEREYRLMESVLRYLTVRVDKLMLRMEKLQEERATQAAAEEARAAESPAPKAEAAEEKPAEPETKETGAEAQTASETAEPTAGAAETESAKDEAGRTGTEGEAAESSKTSPEAEEKS